jgi:DNA-binding response OmpR family regulator
VRAQLRRAHRAAAAATVAGADWRRDARPRAAYLILADGNEDELAASEFDLLKLFIENPNRTLTRDWLLETTAHREADAFDRAIDHRIMRLRRKVEADPRKPQAIRSVRGVGYRFVPPTD